MFDVEGEIHLRCVITVFLGRPLNRGSTDQGCPIQVSLTALPVILHLEPHFQTDQGGLAAIGDNSANPGQVANDGETGQRAAYRKWLAVVDRMMFVIPADAAVGALIDIERK